VQWFQPSQMKLGLQSLLAALSLIFHIDSGDCDQAWHCGLQSQHPILFKPPESPLEVLLSDLCISPSNYQRIYQKTLSKAELCEITYHFLICEPLHTLLYLADARHDPLAAFQCCCRGLIAQILRKISLAYYGLVDWVFFEDDYLEVKFPLWFELS